MVQSTSGKVAVGDANRVWKAMVRRAVQAGGRDGDWRSD